MRTDTSRCFATRCLPILLVILLALAVFAPTWAQEDGEPDTIALEDEVDSREQALLYGIDSDVLSVLGDLQSDKIDRYNDLLVGVLAETRNPDISQKIYMLWAETEWAGGFAAARSELQDVIDDERFETPVVQSALAYLAGGSDEESVPLIQELIDLRDSRVAASAVRAIGTIAQESGPEIASGSGEILLERLMKEDPLAEEDLVAAIIVSLGALKYGPSADELILIAEDEGASFGHRRLSCVSVGQIGRPEDYEIIERIYYESDDATLRAYALAGIAEFPDIDSTEILVQALKRDSFWRIRVTAAEKLGETNAGRSVGDLLRYKAENDPVNHVRIASLKALGAIGDGQSRRFLQDYYQDRGKATDVRLAALSVLVENRLAGTNDAVNAVMDALWEKDEGRFLEFTCRDLSRSDWGSLAPVFERMLEHDNWLLQVYGIRGIRRNGLTGLNGKIEALDADGVDGRVRREVTTGR